MAEFQLLDGLRLKAKPTNLTSMWEDFEFGVPGKYMTYFEDFHAYNSGDWTVTNASGGSVALATSAPCVGGVLLITNANSDNAYVALQKVGHSVVPTSGSKIYFEVRFQCNEATEIDWTCGLIVTDTDVQSGYTDGVAFIKNDGDAFIDFIADTSSTIASESAIGTFAASTYVTLGMKITGTSQVEYFVNGVSQGTITQNLPTVPLRFTFHVQDGDSGGTVGATTASIDYIFLAQERPGY